MCTTEQVEVEIKFSHIREGMLLRIDTNIGYLATGRVIFISSKEVKIAYQNHKEMIITTARNNNNYIFYRVTEIDYDLGI